jgi:hypothetical protein
MTFATAPELSLFGPTLLKLTSKDTQVRLIVESSGEGSVVAKLGSATLGTKTLRPGNNDLRFSLSAGQLQTLRRTSNTLVLTLTPVSSDGKATGQAVTRNVTVDRPSLKRKVKLKRK